MFYTYVAMGQYIQYKTNLLCKYVVQYNNETTLKNYSCIIYFQINFVYLSELLIITKLRETLHMHVY